MSYNAEIIKLIDKVCGAGRYDPANPDVPLIEAGLDSLDYVTVLMALEDKYAVEIPQIADEQLWSLKKLAGYIATAVAGD